MKERLRIVIDEKGNVQAEVLGAKGSSCHKEIEEINRLCGGDARITKKPEFFVKEDNKEKVKQRRG